MRCGLHGKAAAASILLVGLTGCPSATPSATDSSRAGSGRVEGDAALNPPVDLACTAVGLDVFLSWRNGDSYSSVVILQDGRELATLTGEAESYSLSVSQAGSYTFSVKGRSSEGSSEAAECTVEAGGAPPVEDLRCAYEETTGAVTVSWRVPEGGTIDAIQVSRNGISIAVLGPTATTYIDREPATGEVTYEVRTVWRTQPSVESSCRVSVPGLQGISELTGTLDAQSGDITLRWRNGDAYDSVVVVLGDLKVAELSGDSTTFQFDNETFGIFQFSVFGKKGNLTSSPAFVEVDAGKLEWESQSDAAGYYVYVWNAGEAEPSKEAPAATIGPVLSLELADLYAAGCLPASTEGVELYVALAAFDDLGNVSDLSEPVAFTWRVFENSSVQ